LYVLLQKLVCPAMVEVSKPVIETSRGWSVLSDP
jgi:hypothetical protein